MEELECAICMQIIYKAVTLIPCLHNYCGGCISDNIKRGNITCPICSL